ncbi:uncharacterized protein LOC117653772 [Thrips palmi]|uniref:Uncharacterized protein LOC117653772 n=1 Tax=Thrips palmi TaxID=161013 RepID=A0A6P9ADW1_THRPL|nr:uncharacterized protein LOC117653772 [Thrips palmi]XP_034255549.1 uncharacterized protein LOC117653772 [Thrips palmi]
MLEHPLWKDALQELRPAFNPPKKDVVGGRLLNAEYDTVMVGAAEKIKSATHLGIACDGYKNNNGDGLLNFVVLTPESVFYKTLELKDKREDSEFVAGELDKLIIELDPQKVVIIITDNVAYNVVAWEIIKAKYPHIETVGCSAHCLNLLMNDIGKLRSLVKLETMAKVLCKGIRGSRRALAFFKQEQKRLYQRPHSIKLPSATRFWGIVIMFESILENKSALQSTVLEATTDPHPKDPEEKKKFYLRRKVKNIALDDEYFFTRLAEWINALKPIAHAIEASESDSALLSDVPKYFCDIYEKSLGAMESSGLKKLVPAVKKLINNRKSFACKAVHYAACLVDPRYKGAFLTPAEKIEGSEYIANLCDTLNYSQKEKEEVLGNLTEFRGNAGIWAMNSVANSYHGVHPALWWKTTCDDQPLTPIAVRLLTMPSASASVERNWSCYGRTHTKVRNRLQNVKTGKLVAIQMNLKYSLPRHLLKKSPKKRPRSSSCPPAPTSGGEGEGNEAGLEVSDEEEDFFDYQTDEDSSGSEWEDCSDEDGEDENDEDDLISFPDVDGPGQEGQEDQPLQEEVRVPVPAANTGNTRKRSATAATPSEQPPRKSSRVTRSSKN